MNYENMCGALKIKRQIQMIANENRNRFSLLLKAISPAYRIEKNFQTVVVFTLFDIRLSQQF
jgi:hypothetical protein